MLKRSQINRAIREAIETFARHGIALPPWAHWAPADWDAVADDPAYDGVREAMLGWDVTDFGSGRFETIGRTLFTARNGVPGKDGKTYAQKYLYDPPLQRAPAHFHRAKMEDICCLAGGAMCVRLTDADDAPSDEPLTVRVDGVARRIEAGGIVRLAPGESVTIPPRTIHQFWGAEDTEPAVSMEISSVCDDVGDNFFLEPAERFPAIEEDEAPLRRLCHEYPRSSRASR